MRRTDFAVPRSSAVPDQALSSEVLAQYLSVRHETEQLCEPLAIEDYGIQAMPDVSPPKWHLAHTSWFFETFLLAPYLPGYQVYHPRFGYLFNSYYQTVGSFFPRPQRGLLSRPTVEEVYRYRAHVDGAMAELLDNTDASRRDQIISRTVLGLHHEQQHQELLLTDIKYNFAFNPLRPAYRPAPEPVGKLPVLMQWLGYDGGLREIGFSGTGFAYDNETPRHKVFLEDFQLASRLVTNGEFLAFIEDGGYRRADLWLSDGWAALQQRDWQAPLYWEKPDGEWWTLSLAGLRRLDLSEPVCHVSFYEADAYARWCGKRLPSEAEWEVAAQDCESRGNLREAGFLQPVAAEAGARNEPVQLFGDVWEWTQSPYRPYPGFQPLSGSLGEYNGKFMCNQMVLRGGSCVTPQSHIAATYRNFFYPADRWQFMGIRLAGDAD
ncbi:ergothioneine biosynthesis protein EgtB [Methylobacter sp. YRD-M1]|uniref:ergothioneine biosynthesis protein EgtB n=1 Tax=Methylobacter sp. YRD-M1 TaxID=2911520 RepID=UPI00227C6976|nr:ergothioneine biosynthesis protein EgtB [Methylobacter sp. YRD-M1]WAK00882.1 ergothioneine biosynthesis protein EgtB [Methylobacter sp. YRD-M1]